MTDAERIDAEQTAYRTANRCRKTDALDLLAQRAEIALRDLKSGKKTTGEFYFTITRIEIERQSIARHAESIYKPL